MAFYQRLFAKTGGPPIENSSSDESDRKPASKAVRFESEEEISEKESDSEKLNLQAVIGSLGLPVKNTSTNTVAKLPNRRQNTSGSDSNGQISSSDDDDSIGTRLKAMENHAAGTVAENCIGVSGAVS